jgi:hypothetical protein
VYVRCPDSTHLKPPHHGPLYVVGCGHEFLGEVDREGLIDCPNCGMWFDIDAADLAILDPQPKGAAMSPLTTPPDPSSMEGNVGIDHKERVYVVRNGEAAEVIPWAVVTHKVWAYATELLIDPPPAVPEGSLEAYDTMLNLQAALKARFDRTGEQACSDLSSGLGGLEGRRVKVLAKDGAIREFTVGISHGWLPHHIEIRRDGPSVAADPSYEQVWVEGEDY